MQEIYCRALKRAAEILGGEDALCGVLKVPSYRLYAWLSGHEMPPMGVFLKAVDVISSTSAVSDREHASGANLRDETARRASEMHASILSLPSPFPGARSPVRCSHSCRKNSRRQMAGRWSSPRWTQPSRVPEPIWATFS
jgi:hypothetical protein